MTTEMILLWEPKMPIKKVNAVVTVQLLKNQKIIMMMLYSWLNNWIIRILIRTQWHLSKSRMKMITILKLMISMRNGLTISGAKENEMRKNLSIKSSMFSISIYDKFNKCPCYQNSSEMQMILRRQLTEKTLSSQATSKMLHSSILSHWMKMRFTRVIISSATWRKKMTTPFIITKCQWTQSTHISLTARTASKIIWPKVPTKCSISQ